MGGGGRLAFSLYAPSPGTLKQLWTSFAGERRAFMLGMQGSWATENDFKRFQKQTRASCRPMDHKAW